MADDRIARMLDHRVRTAGCESSVKNGTGLSQLPKRKPCQTCGQQLAFHRQNPGFNAFQCLVSLGRFGELARLSGGTYLQILYAQDDFPIGIAGLEIRRTVGAITIDCEMQRIQG